MIVILLQAVSSFRNLFITWHHILSEREQIYGKWLVCVSSDLCDCLLDFVWRFVLRSQRTKHTGVAGGGNKFRRVCSSHWRLNNWILDIQQLLHDMLQKIGHLCEGDPRNEHLIREIYPF